MSFPRKPKHLSACIRTRPETNEILWLFYMAWDDVKNTARCIGKHGTLCWTAYLAVLEIKAIEIPSGTVLYQKAIDSHHHLHTP